MNTDPRSSTKRHKHKHSGSRCPDFFFDSNLRIGPNDSTSLQTQRQLSEILPCNSGSKYDLVVFVGANSRAAQNEIPEPATVVLLVSGLHGRIYEKTPRT